MNEVLLKITNSSTINHIPYFPESCLQDEGIDGNNEILMKLLVLLMGLKS